MSRKFWASVGTVTVVALAIVLAPFLHGYHTETRLREAVRSANRSLGPVVETEITDYQRGWFSAQIKAVVRIRIGEITEPFTASFEVVHGPLPLLEIARGKAPFELVGARFSGRLGPQPLDKRTCPVARATQDDPIDVQAVIGLGGSARVKVAFTKLDQPAKAIGWQAGFASLSASRDFSRIAAKTELRGFSFRDVGHERALEIGLFRASARPDANTNQPVVEVRLDSLRASKRDWQAEADEVFALLARRKGPMGASESKASVTVKMADVKYRDYVGVNLRWKLSGVTASGETTFQKDKATLKGRYRVKEMNSAETAYGLIDGSWTFTFEGAGAPSDLAQAWSAVFSSDDKHKPNGPRESASASTNAAGHVAPLQQQEEMVTKIARAGQLSQIDMQSVQYEQEPPPTAESRYRPRENRNKGLLRVDLDEEFLNAVLFEIAELLADRTTYFQQDYKIDKAEVIGSLFRSLGIDKFIRKQTPRYRGTVRWSEGIIQANGKPLDVWTLVSALAMRETIIHPRLSLRIEKLDSRGGLDQAQVTTAVKTAAKKLANCIWQARGKAPTPPIREEVKVAWEIDKTGKARVTDIAFTAKENASTKTCLQNVVENDTSYPRSSGTTAASLVIRYELTTE